MVEDANEAKAQKALELVMNWTMGSRPMSREKFQATVELVIEGLEGMLDESDGWDFPEDEMQELNYGEAPED